MAIRAGTGSLVRVTRRIALLTALIVVAGACNRSAEPEPVTTLSLPSTSEATTTTTQTLTETTSTGDDIDDFDVVVRSDSEDGPEVWVLVDPGNYSDVDLESLIVRLIESEDGLYEAHVFDDPEALVAARIAEADRTPEEQALVDAHYLVSLVDGSIVRFQGPFAEFGEYVFGS